MDCPRRNAVLELEGGRHGLFSRQFLLPRRTAKTIPLFRPHQMGTLGNVRIFGASLCIVRSSVYENTPAQVYLADMLLTTVSKPSVGASHGRYEAVGEKQSRISLPLHAR